MLGAELQLQGVQQQIHLQTLQQQLQLQSMQQQLHLQSLQQQQMYISACRRTPSLVAATSFGGVPSAQDYPSIHTPLKTPKRSGHGGENHTHLQALPLPHVVLNEPNHATLYTTSTAAQSAPQSALPPFLQPQEAPVAAPPAPAPCPVYQQLAALAPPSPLQSYQQPPPVLQTAPAPPVQYQQAPAPQPQYSQPVQQAALAPPSPQQAYQQPPPALQTASAPPVQYQQAFAPQPQYAPQSGLFPPPLQHAPGFTAPPSPGQSGGRLMPRIPLTPRGWVSPLPPSSAALVSPRSLGGPLPAADGILPRPMPAGALLGSPRRMGDPSLSPLPPPFPTATAPRVPEVGKVKTKRMPRRAVGPGVRRGIRAAHPSRAANDPSVQGLEEEEPTTTSSLSEPTTSTQTSDESKETAWRDRYSDEREGSHHEEDRRRHGSAGGARGMGRATGRGRGRGRSAYYRNQVSSGGPLHPQKKTTDELVSAGDVHKVMENMRKDFSEELRNFSATVQEMDTMRNAMEEVLASPPRRRLSATPSSSPAAPPSDHSPLTLNEGFRMTENMEFPVGRHRIARPPHTFLPNAKDRSVVQSIASSSFLPSVPESLALNNSASASHPVGPNAGVLTHSPLPTATSILQSGFTGVGTEADHLLHSPFPSREKRDTAPHQRSHHHHEDKQENAPSDAEQHRRKEKKKEERGGGDSARRGPRGDPGRGRRRETKSDSRQKEDHQSAKKKKKKKKKRGSCEERHRPHSSSLSLSTSPLLHLCCLCGESAHKGGAAEGYDKNTMKPSQEMPTPCLTCLAEAQQPLEPAAPPPTQLQTEVETMAAQALAQQKQLRVVREEQHHVLNAMVGLRDDFRVLQVARAAAKELAAKAAAEKYREERKDLQRAEEEEAAQQDGPQPEQWRGDAEEEKQAPSSLMEDLLIFDRAQAVQQEETEAAAGDGQRRLRPSREVSRIPSSTASLSLTQISQLGAPPLANVMLVADGGSEAEEDMEEAILVSVQRHPSLSLRRHSLRSSSHDSRHRQDRMQKEEAWGPHALRPKTRQLSISGGEQLPAVEVQRRESVSLWLCGLSVPYKKPSISGEETELPILMKLSGAEHSLEEDVGHPNSHRSLVKATPQREEGVGEVALPEEGEDSLYEGNDSVMHSPESPNSVGPVTSQKQQSRVIRQGPSHSMTNMNSKSRWSTISFNGPAENFSMTAVEERSAVRAEPSDDEVLHLQQQQGKEDALASTTPPRTSETSGQPSQVPQPIPVLHPPPPAPEYHLFFRNQSDEVFQLLPISRGTGVMGPVLAQQSDVMAALERQIRQQPPPQRTSSPHHTRKDTAALPHPISRRASWSSTLSSTSSSSSSSSTHSSSSSTISSSSRTSTTSVGSEEGPQPPHPSSSLCSCLGELEHPWVRQQLQSGQRVPHRPLKPVYRQKQRTFRPQQRQKSIRKARRGFKAPQRVRDAPLEEAAAVAAATAGGMVLPHLHPSGEAKRCGPHCLGCGQALLASVLAEVEGMGGVGLGKVPALSPFRNPYTASAEVSSFLSTPFLWKPFPVPTPAPLLAVDPTEAVQQLLQQYTQQPSVAKRKKESFTTAPKGDPVVEATASPHTDASGQQFLSTVPLTLPKLAADRVSAQDWTAFGTGSVLGTWKEPQTFALPALPSMEPLLTTHTPSSPRRGVPMPQISPALPRASSHRALQPAAPVLMMVNPISDEQFHKAQGGVAEATSQLNRLSSVADPNYLGIGVTVSTTPSGLENPPVPPYWPPAPNTPYQVHYHHYYKDGSVVHTSSPPCVYCPPLVPMRV